MHSARHGLVTTGMITVGLVVTIGGMTIGLNIIGRRMADKRSRHGKRSHGQQCKTTQPAVAAGKTTQPAGAAGVLGKKIPMRLNRTMRRSGQGVAKPQIRTCMRHSELSMNRSAFRSVLTSGGDGLIHPQLGSTTNVGTHGY